MEVAVQAAEICTALLRSPQRGVASIAYVKSLGSFSGAGEGRFEPPRRDDSSSTLRSFASMSRTSNPLGPTLILST